MKQLVKRLSEARAEQDELAMAERVRQRTSEQLAARIPAEIGDDRTRFADARG